MEIILNELSLGNLPSSLALADKAMSDIVLILNELKKNTQKDIVIRATLLLKNIAIAENYHIQNWLKKNKQEATIFLTAVAQKPIIRNYPYYFYQSAECQGFAYAHENDVLSISYNPLAKWNETTYELTRQLLTEEDFAYIEDKVNILHLSDKQHITIHQNWISRKIKILVENKLSTFQSGKEVWDNRETIFPHLIFCEKVAFQILPLSMNDPNLKTSLQKLLIFNEYLAKLSENSLNIKEIGITISGESEATMNKYSEERTFLCPDKVERVFESHIKLTEWRIYFLQIPQQNTCWIGYIGKHLRTKKYN